MNVVRTRKGETRWGKISAEDVRVPQLQRDDAAWLYSVSSSEENCGVSLVP